MKKEEEVNYNTYTHITDGPYGSVMMHVLGDEKLAERLVDWAEKNKDNEKRKNPAVTTPWGLTLTGDIVDGHALVRLGLDENKLIAFANIFKHPSVVHFTDYGVSVTLHKGRISLKVYSGDPVEEFIQLHEFEVAARNDPWPAYPLGAIHITDEGFVLERYIEREDVVVPAEELVKEA